MNISIDNNKSFNTKLNDTLSNKTVLVKYENKALENSIFEPKERDYANSTQAKTLSERQAQVGTTYCKRMQHVYEAVTTLQKAFTEAKENGPRYLTAWICLLTGTGNLLAGNVVVGGIEMGAAFLEFNKLLNGQGIDLNVAQVFSDIQGSVDMINTLGEANEKSFKVIDANLKLVSDSLESLNNRMGKIDELSDAGMEEVQKAKTEAYNAYENSKKHYEKASKNFIQSQTLMGQAMKEYNESLSYLTTVIKTLKNYEANSQDKDPQELITQLMYLSKYALQKGNKAQRRLTRAYKLQSQGLKALKNGNEKGEQATELYTQACAASQKALFEINLQAEKDKKAKVVLKNAQLELSQVASRNEKIQILAKLAHVDAELGKKLITKTKAISYKSLLFGGVPGALLAGLIGSFFTAPLIGITLLAIGIIGGTAVVNSLPDLLILVRTLLLKQKEYKPLAITDKINFSYDPLSTGLLGIVQGKYSKTQGILKLKLGQDSTLHTIPVNFNQEDGYAIAKADLFALQSKMLDLLEINQITPGECQTIINVLTQVTVEGHKNKDQSFIPTDENNQNIFFSVVNEVIKANKKAKQTRNSYKLKPN